MEQEKNKNMIILLLIGLVIILAVLCALLATDTLSLKSSKKSNNQANSIDNVSDQLKDNNNVNNTTDDSTDSQETNTTNCNCTSYVSQNYGCGINEVDFSKLSEISKGDYNYIKGVYNNKYSLNILSDGKIIINFNNYISNVSNAKDIILFGENSELVYILTSDGNVFKYELSNIENNNYEATKLDDYSNIKNITTYMTRRAHAGGCNYVVLINNDDKYYKLDSVCH